MDIAKMTMLSLAAAAIAGCSRAPEPTEAERFGYRGEDAASTAQTFIVQATGVTNWVPERVITVCEQYEFSANELALVKAAGALMPAEDYAGFEGFDKAADEPWFTTWTKAVEAFGFQGSTGIIAHYNEDRKIWETSESYFSCYWPTREQAVAAQAHIREVLGRQFGPKKFYDFADSWVAEYVRLSVLCAVGQKADGRWSCMLDLRDKCTYGCGPYENVEAQRERLARYRYNKRRVAWRKQMAAVYAQNHQLVNAAATAAGLSASLEGADWAAMSETSPYTICSGGHFEAGECSETNVSELVKAEWDVRREVLKQAFGADLPAVEDVSLAKGFGEELWLGALSTNALYEVRLEMLVPTTPAGNDAGENGAAAGQGQPAEAQPDCAPPAQWRALAIERLQPGLELPTEPKFER